MNKYLTSAITAVVLGSVTMIASAWEPPSEGCLAVRNELGVALDALQECKATTPQKEWDPECADERARFHACSELAVKRARGGICPDGDASEQPANEALCFGDPGASAFCPGGASSCTFEQMCSSMGGSIGDIEGWFDCYALPAESCEAIGSSISAGNISTPIGFGFYGCSTSNDIYPPFTGDCECWNYPDGFWGAMMTVPSAHSKTPQ